jgi:flagellar protein FlgJ
MTKLSPVDFFKQLLPHAQRARREGARLFVSVMLAQNLLETGGVIHPWNNLGGIKKGSAKSSAWWDGTVTNKGTWEVEGGKVVQTAANFRVYKSVYHFYRDQDLLFELARYKNVREAGTPQGQARALRDCGYATDPEYANKIIRIIAQYALEKYDEGGKGEMLKADGLAIIGELQSAFGAAVSTQRKQELNRLANVIRVEIGEKVQIWRPANGGK